MAARPVPHSLAALSLAFGLGVVAAPALAQNYIGTGNVQVNMQALDQLGGARSASLATPQLPLIGSTGKAPKQAAVPAAAQPTGPQALLGETGQAANTVKLRRPGSSTATRKASASAPKASAKTEAAPAAAPPAVAAAPAPAASAPTPAPAITPAPAPQAGAPTQVVPAPPAPAVAAAPSAPAPAPTPAPAPPVAAAPAPTPAPAPAPAPAAAAAPQASVPATPAPAPQATPRAVPAPQVAAAPTPPRAVPAPGPGPGGLVTLAFAGGQGDLPSGGDLAALDALATQHANGEDRLQIRAYAASTVSDGGSGARRLSLTRALAVRQYLIDKGIRSTRIDVRALGAPTDGSAADRVEVAPVGR
ncbi:OmpA family protein [Ferrovibrio terrae]|uniref:OmpA family protein n=1 Tax=Ferrovibrio terrae TaxID=2594003 RepID=A0A516H2B1_9PROT|nr:OmpA family protein [Ferrovibrio terrae]QDO97912.1 OmpA family protein [Ferrovibrio terrae]